MGFDMKEGTVVRWIKKEGDTVNKGEPLAEIETDKAVVEVEAFASGVLSKISVKEGTTVPVGQVIGVIGAPGETVAAPAAPAAQGQPPAASSTRPAARASVAPAPAGRTQAPAQGAAAGPDNGRIKASPLARREAETRGVDLAALTGTGPGGRITRDDVVAFAAQPAAAPVPTAAPSAPAPVTARPPATPAAAPAQAVLKAQLIPFSRMRSAIAGAMARSMREIPHFYVTVQIDMTQAMKLRAEINKTLEAQKIRVSVNDMIIKACAKALLKHPYFNASYTERGVQVHGQVNISVAVALDDGLVAPSITDAASKSLSEIAVAATQLIERARTGVLTASEYTGGTFSVSNLGMFGVEDFTAIITPPQAAVLAVGAVKKTPIVREDKVEIIEAMKVTLSTDHRVADGAQSARFLADVRTLLESPLLLLV
jgi:pyruvate dehydrogenase E2 component (dihydrolipoamide acetyltransferase)